MKAHRYGQPGSKNILYLFLLPEQDFRNIQFENIFFYLKTCRKYFMENDKVFWKMIKLIKEISRNVICGGQNLQKNLFR